MKKALLLFCLSISSFISFAADVELQIQLLTPDIIAEATLDTEPFFKWVKELNTEVETQLSSASGQHEVIVMVTVHPDENASFQVGSRPELDATTFKNLSKKLTKLKSPKTKYTDYSFAIIATINGGAPDKNMDFSPTLLMPLEIEQNEYMELSLKEKKSAFQDWMKNEIIPMLAHFETSVDPQFQGVLNIGKMLDSKSYLNKDVETLTEQNSDYWRAMLEMSGGNQLIPFTRACLHLAKGEFDKADHHLFVVDMFSDESTLAAALLDEVYMRLDIFNEELNGMINKGIELHDAGKYVEAVSYYEKLLKDFPESAWLNYELYFSKSSALEDPDKGINEWKKSKGTIYACDPLYYLSAHAGNGKEGYQMYRRQEINMLFKSKDEVHKDFVSFADIALDLESYGFAGQLYWLILTHFDAEDYGDRNMVYHFLYCLDKLGDKTIIKNFKGDFPTEFEKIEKEREAIMKESTFYNAFEKKD